MTPFRFAFLTLVIASACMGSWAQTDAAQTQHRPGTMTAAEASARHSAARTGRADQMAAMDSKISAMNEAHKELLGAKTPAERNALMAKHMQAMRDGMETLTMMGPNGMGAMKGEKRFPRNRGEREQMMEKRMEMMELMMQMTMDRMPAPTP